jgi:hypothetical protein
MFDFNRRQNRYFLRPEKNRCITKNYVNSFSNLGNGMCPMAFFGKIDIYAVKLGKLDIYGCLKSTY